MMTSLCSGLNAHQIEVFTLAQYPVTGNKYQVTLCKLDALNLLRIELNSKIPDLKQLNTYGLSKSKQLTEAFRCLHKADVYELEYLPAIVIDKKYVTYGIDSVKKALDALKQFKESSHD